MLVALAVLPRALALAGELLRAADVPPMVGALLTLLAGLVGTPRLVGTSRSVGSVGSARVIGPTGTVAAVLSPPGWSDRSARRRRGVDTRLR
jgi:hypothetical protein